MRKILRVILPVLICGFFTLAVVVNASALTLQEGVQAAQCNNCPTNLFGDAGVFKKITDMILYLVGIIAVVMLIIGGIKYLLSGGDAKKVTDAKNTILYAIIGLIVCFLSAAIVNFVISTLPAADNAATAGV